MLSSWTSRVAALAFTTVSACGVIVLSPLLWSEPVVELAIADQPAASDCEGAAAGGDLFDPANPGAITIGNSDVVWAADTDGDGVRYELACYCQPSDGCKNTAPGVFDEEIIRGTETTWAASFTDCDDDSPLVFADDGTSGDALELCDTRDNDCDGTIDEGFTETAVWYVDDDEDGFGDSSTAFLACASAYGPRTVGRSRVAGDCDDDDDQRFPGAPEAAGLDAIDADCNDGASRSLPELCNGIDDNDDGTIDEGWPTGDWYLDADGDGFGDDQASPVSFCLHGPIAGYADNNLDCDDNDATAGGGAEIFGNGIDDDCDTPTATPDTDPGGTATAIAFRQDLDGDLYFDSNVAAITRSDAATAALAELGWFPATGLTTGDCDDTEPLMNLGMTEIAFDGLDNDCVAGSLDDASDDGSGSPIAEVCDGFDNDGDGAIDNGITVAAPIADGTVDFYADLDNDGQGDPGRPIDCGATAPPFPHVVATVSTADTDDTDCDDQDAGVRFDTTIPETCGTTGLGDGRDNNCDGTADAGIDVDSTTILTAATEACDALDNDCNGIADDTLSSADFYPDRDLDGNGEAGSSAVQFCDSLGFVPEFYVDDSALVTDCDDTDDTSTLFLETYYVDEDGDGDGTGPAITQCGVPTAGGFAYVTTNTDCDDDDDQRTGLSTATESCDGIDNDCDQTVDEGLDPVNWYADADDDGRGATNAPVAYVACSTIVGIPAGVTGDYATLNDDCDDNQASAFPGNPEVCDGVDNDCINDVDDGFNPVSWYPDVDNDNRGATNATEAFLACATLVGNPPGVTGDYATANDDCNDTVAGQRVAGANLSDTPATHPGSFVPGDQIFPNAFDAPYDDVDADCQEDNDYDADNDGFASTVETIGAGGVNGDFNSIAAYQLSNSFQFPGGDLPPEDCNDAVNAYNPNAADPFDTTGPGGSGIDSNCDGADGVDLDGDGVGGGTAPGQDCVDLALVNGVQDTFMGFDSDMIRPDATDDPYDDVDENCDQLNDYDADEDDYAAYEPTLVANGTTLAAYLASESYSCTGQYAVRSGETTTACILNLPADDCDELRDDVYPGAPDRADGVDFDVDNNCDGAPGVDVDGDGEASIDSGGADCGPNDDTRFPGAPEICDTKDNDCNSIVDDGGTEICDGLDNNCDGSFDETFIQSAFYVDSDLDGYGLTNTRFIAKGDTRPAPTYCVDAVIRNALTSSDTVVNAANQLGDCDDNNFFRNPGQEEVCGDGVDNDCDSATPDSVVGGSGGDEIACNGVDDDCDELIDEVINESGVEVANPNLGTFYIDRDGDGFGDETASSTPSAGEQFSACRFAIVPGFATNNDDCDDANPAISPDAKEVCNNNIDEDCSIAENDSLGFPVEACDGFDNNCGGQIDEGLPLVTFYVDSDGDGYGSSVVYSHQGVLNVTDNRADPKYCADAIIPGASPVSGDCNDNNAAVNPGAAEVCGDSIDNDCNNKVDNNPVTGGGPEPIDICNGIDDNCVGGIDEGTNRIPWYLDADRDGFGSLRDASPVMACAEADGSRFVGNARSTNQMDCDDTTRSVNPDATEVPESGVAVDNNCDGSFGPSAEDVCDGIDNDGDGEIDEDVFDPATGVDLRVPYYTDRDGDGAGDINGAMILACSGQSVVGFGELNDPTDADCDDLDSRVFPGAVEVCENSTDVDGIDTDCDGSLGGVEICDGLDNSCTGTPDDNPLFSVATFYADDDGDGFGSAARPLPVQYCAQAEIPGASRLNTDCDDRVAAVSPGNIEICGDNFDNNCDIVAPGLPKNDQSGTEVCNGLDDDCDGVIDDVPGETADVPYFIDSDGDGDGRPADSVLGCATTSGDAPDGFSLTGTDCNDNNAAVSPTATEVCNGQDDNCLSTIDALADVPVDHPSSVWYRDADGDGYGSPINPVRSCDTRIQLGSVNPAFMRDSRDCLDAGSSNSGRQVYATLGDPSSGFAPTNGSGLRPQKVLPASAVNPGATEIWYDGIDQDCFDSFVTGNLLDFDQDYDGQRCDGSVGWPEPGCPPDVIGDDCVDSGSVLSTVSDGNGGFVAIPANEIARPGRAPGAGGDLGVPFPNFTPTDSGIDGVNQTCRLDSNGNVADDFDRDNDGFSSEALVNAVPNGYVYEAGRAPATDCSDDTSVQPLAPQINPAAEEICGDGIDNNCQGGSLPESDGEFGNTPISSFAPLGVDLFTYFPDADGDLYGDEDIEAFACVGPTTVPGEPSVLAQTDNDAIRYIVRGRDCDDTDDQISPEATEIFYNKVVEDCDTLNDFDADNDNFASTFRVLSVYGSSTGTPLTRAQVAIISPAQRLAAISLYEADIIAKGWADLPATDCIDEVADVVPNSDGFTGSAAGIPAGSFPGAVEQCDLVDNNCNGQFDENVVDVTYYPDRDADGFGDAEAPLSEERTDCKPPPDETGADPYSYVSNNTDCYDDDDDVATLGTTPLGTVFTDPADVHPNTQNRPLIDELYDGYNQDCLDRNDFDKDDDGFASTADVAAFDAQADDPYSTLYSGPLDLPADDCDDEDFVIKPTYVNPAPSGPFLGDSVGNDSDDNCDGIPGVDEDQDGVANEESGGQDCVDDPAESRRGIPADKIHGANTSPFPFTKDAAVDDPYNDVDENCDQQNDFDRDGDFQASSKKVIEFADATPGWDYLTNSVSIGFGVYPATDCEDGENYLPRDPSAPDVNNIPPRPTNVSGLWRYDQLADAADPGGDVVIYVQSATRRLRARDIRDGVGETYYDNIDQNCDGQDDFDQDDDGYVATDLLGTGEGDFVEQYNNSASTLGIDTFTPPTPDDIVFTGYTGGGLLGDCDDNDDETNPIAADPPTNGKDNNCDGANGVDGDNDGYASVDFGGTDCNDSNPLVNPGVLEVCEAAQVAQIDNDCDGNPNTSRGEYARVRTTVGSGTTISYNGDTLGTALVDDLTVDGINLIEVSNVIRGVLNNPYYVDSDGDTFGNLPLIGTEDFVEDQVLNDFYLCGSPSGSLALTADATDCDDTDASVNPDPTNLELCNGKDDNCNGEQDEPIVGGAQLANSVLFYQDNDGDGYGTPEATTLSVCNGYLSSRVLLEDRLACGNEQFPEPVFDNGTVVPSSITAYGMRFPADTGSCYGTFQNDCNDSEALIHPNLAGAPSFEILDGIDNDCDGRMPIVEVDCDDDSQLPLLPIPASSEGDIGSYGGKISSVAELNRITGVEGLDDNFSPTAASGGMGLQPCVTLDGDGNQVLGAAPRVECLGDRRSLTCDLSTGFWVMNTSALSEEQIQDSIRINLEANDCDQRGDCDDQAANRCVGRSERCDGVDNNCERATDLGVHLDRNRNGLPDHMEVDAETPGNVSGQEMDFDGDGFTECVADAPIGLTKDSVTLRGGTPYQTPGGDCNNTCSVLTPEYEGDLCAGFQGSCPALNLGIDDDGDNYLACGAYGGDGASEETLYVLAYAQQTLTPTPSAPEEMWNVVPLVMPRRMLNPQDEVTDEPMACDTDQWEALNELLDVDNVLALEEDENGELVPLYDEGDLMGTCVRVDFCRQALENDPDNLPDYCPEDLEKIRCVVTALTAPARVDAGVFDLDLPGCLQADGGAWWPEQVVFRSLWSQERIVEARRVVTEWDCYRHTGDFGCVGSDFEEPDYFVPRTGQPSEAGGFREKDNTWRDLEPSKLVLDVGNELMFNRFLPIAETSGLMLGCWGDTSRGLEVLGDTFEVVGGDCADIEVVEGEFRPNELEAVNRGQYEGPDDLLALFDGRVVDCDVCSDGLDNNCNGTADCLEAACARCYVGQASGGCGADACTAGGCSSTSTGGIQSTGALSLLMLMLGLGWRRRREDEEDAA